MRKPNKLTVGQTDRQTDRQTQTDRQIDRERKKERENEICIYETDGRTDRQNGGTETDRQQESVCLSACLSVCLPACLSASLSAALSVFSCQCEASVRIGKHLRKIKVLQFYANTCSNS